MKSKFLTITMLAITTVFGAASASCCSNSCCGDEKKQTVFKNEKLRNLLTALQNVRKKSDFLKEKNPELINESDDVLIYKILFHTDDQNDTPMAQELGIFYKPSQEEIKENDNPDHTLFVQYKRESLETKINLPLKEIVKDENNFDSEELKTAQNKFRKYQETDLIFQWLYEKPLASEETTNLSQQFLLMGMQKETQKEASMEKVQEPMPTPMPTEDTQKELENNDNE